MWWTYRNHSIMAFPSFDAVGRNWRVQADISWSSGKVRESAFVRYATRAATEAEAVNCAHQESVKWIDGRLRRGNRNLFRRMISSWNRSP
jgi:hypothetical protein